MINPCAWCNSCKSSRSWAGAFVAILFVAGFGPLALVFYSWKFALLQLFAAAFSGFALISAGMLTELRPVFLLFWAMGIVAAGFCTVPRSAARS